MVRTPFKLCLDFDELTKEQVEEEAKRITKENLHLGPPTVEPSEGGNFHVTWHRSHLRTFDEGYNIALNSKADKNWLDICKKYQVFALFTRDSLETTLKLRQQKRTYQLESGKVEGTKLIITPEDNNEHRRILGLCESMTNPQNNSYDSTWSYRVENKLGDCKATIMIGCLDFYQAQRRIRLMRDKIGMRVKE